MKLTSATTSWAVPLKLLFLVTVAGLHTRAMGMAVPTAATASTDNNMNSNSRESQTQWHESTHTHTATATAEGGNSIPTTGADWVSLSKDKQWQPALSESNDPAVQERLVHAQRRFLNYKDSFVDGSETYYDPNSQFWRLLGFYIDCNAQDEDDHKDRKRTLRTEQEQEVTQEQSHRALGDDDKAECQRYLMWAAYIDLDYQGGGAGEYQYFNTYNQEWDTRACEIHGNGRCAKLDCHLPDTSMQLLGFFKNAGYDDFFEQLFKHEGVCLWKNDEYDFMDAYRTVWPQYCTQSTISYKSSYLYYDIKPTNNAGMGIALYTDSKCSEEYKGGKSASNVLSQKTCNYDDDCVNLDINLDTFLEEWNSSMDLFKVCVPCVAFDIDDDNRRQRKRKQRQLGDEDGNNHYDDDSYVDPDDGHFQCDDDAGYTNVNQCMKFGTHTDLETGTFEDVALATQQNTVLNPYMDSIHTKGFQQVKKEYTFLVFSIMVLASGGVFFAWGTRRRRHRRSSRHEAPLV